MGDSDAQSVLLMPSLLHGLVWLQSLRKTLLHQDRMLKTEAGFPVLLWCLRIFRLDFNPECVEI